MLINFVAIVASRANFLQEDWYPIVYQKKERKDKRLNKGKIVAKTTTIWSNTNGQG
jgi:hypothetical protein